MRRLSNVFGSLALSLAIVSAPFAILNVSAKAMVAENGYRIQGLQRQIDDQKTLAERTRLENAKMSSLERIKSVATGKLAMTEPSVEATIISMPGNDVTSPEYASLTTKEVR